MKSRITTDSMIDEDELPVRANLKVICKNDPDNQLSDDEIQDRNEFIRCYILQQLGILLTIPKPDNDKEFFMTREDWQESAFNTIDYYRMQKPRLTRRNHRVKEILERVRHLAIIYSIIQSEKDRQRILNQYKRLVNTHFKEEIEDLTRRYRKTSNPQIQEYLMDKIMQNKGHLTESQKIWEQYAPKGQLESLTKCHSHMSHQESISSSSI